VLALWLHNKRYKLKYGLSASKAVEQTAPQLHPVQRHAGLGYELKADKQAQSAQNHLLRPSSQGCRITALQEVVATQWR
jgi:hypothetical protein